MARPPATRTPGRTASARLGPQAGPFAGFVQDPITGNLVDPGTGREVDAGGRFLDPITGQPFGEPSPFATRLEGLVGGTAPAAPGVLPGLGAGIAGIGGPGIGVPAAGVIGAGGPGVVPVGLGGPGATAVGGAVPFLPPGAVGAVGPVGARGGGATRFAGLYGGAVPPSLVGSNPATGQLQQIAARNLEHRAAVAQRYAAIASGQPTGQYGYFPPPVAGVGGGGTGAARSARSGGRRAVIEPPGVWGAVPGRGDRRRAPGAGAETEDDDVWTGGGTAAAGLLDGR